MEPYEEACCHKVVRFFPYLRFGQISQRLNVAKVFSYPVKPFLFNHVCDTVYFSQGKAPS
jgi:hypothetical protein